MKNVNIQLLASCLLIANGLGSCVPLASSVLFVGAPEVENAMFTPNQSKDGPALIAKFSVIKDLAVDSEGNVYVVDDPDPATDWAKLKLLSTSFLIRKISPDGQVTTFAGRNKASDIKPIYSLPLVSGTEIEVVDHSLYFINLGCLLRFDLTQTMLDPKFEEVMGKCISAEDAERGLREPDFKPAAEMRFGSLLIDSIGNLYFGVSQGNKGFNYVLNKQGETKLLPQFFGARFQAADSKGYFYWNREGDADLGPEGIGARSIMKYDIEGKGGPPIPGRSLLKSPQIFTMDKRDYFYLIDQNEIKRLSPEGKLQPLAQLTSNRGQKLNVRYMAVNPESTVLYLADSTAVYQLPLQQVPK